MGVRDLLFRIVGRDASDRAFGSVKRNLRDVEGAARRTRERVRDVGRGLRNVGLAGSAASAGLVASFRDSIALYDEQAKAEARVRQAIAATGGAAGVTARQLFEQASGLQAVSRFGDEAILGDVTTQLVTFGNIAEDQLTRATRLTLDLATATDKGLAPTATRLGRALAEPADGLTRLGRAGIVFTNAQEEMVERLAESGRLAEAQALILDKVAAQVGGQAEAALAGAGSIEQLGNAWGDLKEVVGGELADRLDGITGMVRGVVDWFNALSPASQSLAVNLGLVAAALPPVTAALGALTIAASALGGPVTTVITGISALIGVVAALWPETDRLAGSTGTATEAFRDERRAAEDLSGVLASDTQLSAAAVAQKLGEARARFQNVQAIVAERRALARTSPEYRALAGEIEQVRTRLDNLRNTPRDGGVFAPQANRADIEFWIDRLGELSARQRALIDPTGELFDLLERTRENMRQLGEMTGDVPEVPGEVPESVGAVGGAAGDAADEVDALGTSVETLAGAPVWDALKQNITGLATGVSSFGDLWRGVFEQAANWLLDLAFSPAWDTLASNVEALLGQGGTGGTPARGNPLTALASGVGELLGFDRGGAFTVGGVAGIDRNLAPVRLSAGEEVQVTRRGEAPATNVTVNIQTPDPENFRRSRAQIGREISRAVAAGQRGR